MTLEGRDGVFWWIAAAAVLALLVWQGHRLAAWLPQFEETIERLGVWGPVVFCLAILLLGRCSFRTRSSASLRERRSGSVPGRSAHFAVVYVMCLGIQWIAGHWLASPVQRLLEKRASLRPVLSMASKGGMRFAFLVRLVPLNQALVSYAMGAAGVPLRSAAAGNLGMFTHMFPIVYLGAAAVQVTRMASTAHPGWRQEGVLMMLGLGVCATLALVVSRWAWKAMGLTPGKA